MSAADRFWCAVFDGWVVGSRRSLSREAPYRWVVLHTGPGDTFPTFHRELKGARVVSQLR